MDSLFATRQTLLTILNDELNTQYDRLADAFSDWRQRQPQEEQADAVGVCGFPCMGDCQTCTQSNADLDAFFGAPAEVVVVVAEEPAPAPIVSEASASVEGVGPTYAEESVEVHHIIHARDASQDSALEAARAMDAIEEAQVSGEAYEYDEYDAYGCHCHDCLNYDDEGDDD
jgi:hypothetical protein